MNTFRATIALSWTSAGRGMTPDEDARHVNRFLLELQQFAGDVRLIAHCKPKVLQCECVLKCDDRDQAKALLKYAEACWMRRGRAGSWAWEIHDSALNLSAADSRVR